MSGPRPPPWLILPTYNEAENVEAILAAAGEVLAGAAPEGFRVLVVDDGSPDGTGEIADRAGGRARAGCRCCIAREKNGIGPAYLAGFRHALDHGAAYVMEMDSDFSHDPADLARLLAGGALPAPTWRSARATCPAAASPTGACLRRFISEGGSTYARSVLGLRVRDLTGGFKCFRREVLEAIHFDGVRSQGYAFQVELTYRAVQAGFRGRRGADRLPRPPARARARCPGASPPRRCGWCRGCASGRPRRRPMHEGWMPRPTPSPTACATRARRCARGSATRPWCSAAGSPAPRWRPPACSPPCSRHRPSLDHGYIQVVTLQPPFAVGDVGDVLRRARAATCSCSRCTRWRASPASSPAARCRCRPTIAQRPLALGARTRRTHRDRLRRLRHDLLALERQAYLLGHTLAGVAHFLRVSPGAAAARRAPARDPRADRPVPAAGRLDHRQPPRRVGAAARRHLRHRRHRRARPRDRRADRGLRLPAPVHRAHAASTRRSCATPKGGSSLSADGHTQRRPSENAPVRGRWNWSPAPGRVRPSPPRAHWHRAPQEWARPQGCRHCAQLSSSRGSAQMPQPAPAKEISRQQQS